jgi:hypothetical protein
MGISNYSSELFKRIVKANSVSIARCDARSALMLGRQQMHDGSTPESFFASLGFESIESLDSDKSEGATVIHDLNQEVNPSLHENFSLVFDGGTLEHVFDVKTFLFNCSALVGLEGLVVHQVPVNNHINHGFYQISPTLLLAFYTQNGFTPVGIGFHVAEKRASLRVERELFWTEDKIELARLTLSCRIILPPDITPEHLVSMSFVAKKTSRPPQNIPTQPFYSSSYKSPESAAMKAIYRIPTIR